MMKLEELGITSRSKIALSHAAAALGCCALVFMSAVHAQTVLHTFPQPSGTSTDGQYPLGLLLAKDGDFYGVTFGGGGQSQNGTVLRVTLGGEEKVIHAFADSDDGNSSLTGTGT